MAMLMRQGAEETVAYRIGLCSEIARKSVAETMQPIIIIMSLLHQSVLVEV